MTKVKYEITDAEGYCICTVCRSTTNNSRYKQHNINNFVTIIY